MPRVHAGITPGAARTSAAVRTMSMRSVRNGAMALDVPSPTHQRRPLVYSRFVHILGALVRLICLILAG